MSLALTARLARYHRLCLAVTGLVASFAACVTPYFKVRAEAEALDVAISQAYPRDAVEGVVMQHFSGGRDMAGIQMTDGRYYYVCNIGEDSSSISLQSSICHELARSLVGKKISGTFIEPAPGKAYLEEAVTALDQKPVPLSPLRTYSALLRQYATTRLVTAVVVYLAVFYCVVDFLRNRGWWVRFW